MIRWVVIRKGPDCTSDWRQESRGMEERKVCRKVELKDIKLQPTSLAYNRMGTHKTTAVIAHNFLPDLWRNDGWIRFVGICLRAVSCACSGIHSLHDDVGSTFPWSVSLDISTSITCTGTLSLSPSASPT